MHTLPALPLYFEELMYSPPNENETDITVVDSVLISRPRCMVILSKSNFHLYEGGVILPPFYPTYSCVDLAHISFYKQTGSPKFGYGSHVFHPSRLAKIKLFCGELISVIFITIRQIRKH